MKDPKLTRLQLLAAEMFSYSYANYLDHLGIGNIRFDQLMPQHARTLELALQEQWPITRLASELEIDTDEAAAQLRGAREALKVVDAENPAESFRESVRQLVERAAEAGLSDDDAVEQLVTQICYRVADLDYLLKVEGSALGRYSRHLRSEPGVDYHEGYFDEEE